MFLLIVFDVFDVFDAIFVLFLLIIALDKSLFIVFNGYFNGLKVDNLLFDWIGYWLLWFINYGWVFICGRLVIDWVSEMTWLM